MDLELIKQLASAKGIEREFVEALPARFRLHGFSSYQDWKKTQRFNSVVEGVKMKQAYMEAFVTATYMTQKEDKDAGSVDVHGGQVPEEGNVLPLPSGAEREAELPRGGSVGTSGAL